MVVSGGGGAGGLGQGEGGLGLGARDDMCEPAHTCWPLQWWTFWGCSYTYTNIVCHLLFAPAGSPWRVWSSARPRRDNEVRYQFVVYTREAPAAAAAAGGSRGRQVDVVGSTPLLPPGVASKHDEHQVCRMARRPP